MKDMTSDHFQNSAMGMNHNDKEMSDTSSARAGVGKVPSTGPGGREIPGDTMPGTQREYPPLTGDMGGQAAFGFGVKRPR